MMQEVRLLDKDIAFVEGLIKKEVRSLLETRSEYMKLSTLDSIVMQNKKKELIDVINRRLTNAYEVLEALERKVVL